MANYNPMNLLSTKQLMAIYNALKNATTSIDTILEKRCMKKIQHLLDESRFTEAQKEINHFFGTHAEYSVVKCLCILTMCNHVNKGENEFGNNKHNIIPNQQKTKDN